MNFKILKQDFDRLLKRQPKNRVYVRNNVDELGCIKLPANYLIPPYDYIQAYNKKGRLVTAVKWAKPKQFDYSEDPIITEKFKSVAAFFIIINTLYSKKMWDYNGLQEVRHLLRRGLLYVYYAHHRQKRYRDIDVEGDKVLEYLEPEIDKAIKNPIKYRKEAKERFPWIFTSKDKARFEFVGDEKILSQQKGILCIRARRLMREKCLAGILLSMAKKKADTYTRVLKNGKRVWNYKTLLEEANRRIQKKGLDPVGERCLRKYMDDILTDLKMTIDELYNKVIEKKKLVTIRERRVVIGRIRAYYTGTWLRIDVFTLCYSHMVGPTPEDIVAQNYKRKMGRYLLL